MERNSSRDSDIKMLMTSAIPESTKKLPKDDFNVFEGEESHQRLLKFSPTQISTESFLSYFFVKKIPLSWRVEYVMDGSTDQ